MMGIVVQCNRINAQCIGIKKMYDKTSRAMYWDCIDFDEHS